MKKKLFALSLALAVLMGLLPFHAKAAILASGVCGADGNEVTWTLERKTAEQDGRMTISGMGAMKDYTKAEDVPWHAYLAQVESVVIEAGVTTVGKNVFQGCTNLKSVTLPDGLTSIGDAAFYHCDALSNITTPGGTETALPENLTLIGKNAFGFCALTKLDIPAKVTSIGESVFYKCAALTEITVKEENKAYSAVDGILFNKDKTILICYPAKKSGEEYTVPDTVTEIGSYAFYSASELKTVTFPKVKDGGLTKIGAHAFAYSAVSELTIPSSLKAVEEFAFYECLGLSDNDGKPVGTVNYSGNRQQWSSLIMGDGNYRLTNSNVIFDNMQQDNALASGECGTLGNNAFWSVRKVKEKDENNRDIEVIELLISGAGAMKDYRSATDVPWASYKAETEAEAEAEAIDYRPQIQKVRVEEGITTLSDYACYDCANLTTATLPTTLKSIGSRVFADCAKLTDIKVKLNSEEDAPGLSKTAVESIGSYAFNGCSTLASVTLPETLKTIGGRAFLNCVALTEITIPSAVTEIGDWAFRKCETLTTFTMEPLKEDETPHYMSLGAYALADCKALETLSFTENLTVIGDYALMNCAKLTAVDLPSSVTGIGNCVFLSCPALAAVNVPDENETYCTGGTKYSGMLMNKDQTYILYYPGGRTGQGCRIPESVTNIASFAFQTATEQLQTVAYEGNWSQWQEVIIGEQGNDRLFAILNPRLEVLNDPEADPPADPRDKTQPFYCEGEDTNNNADATEVISFTVEQTETEKTAKAEVYCGKNVSGIYVYCAMYDTDGRFLSMETQEMTSGEERTLSFALSDRTETVRLFVVDGKRVPQCKCKVYPPQDRPPEGTDT